MIQKIATNIFFGLRGIYTNSHIGIAQKVLLFIDYVSFIFILIFVHVLKIKIHFVRINSFKYTVYFDNFTTFFYLFNEIFCKSVYSPIKIINYYDLGANIGLTILWYKYFNPSLKVLAFEPNPECYKFLIKNIKTNHLDNVISMPIALSGKKGISNFYSIKDDIQTLDSGLTLNQNLSHTVFQVKTDKLSRYITKRIDLLKMDIEGGEYAVFKDLITSKKIRKIKKIIFEAHFFNREQKKILANLIIQLKKMGHVEQLENSQLTKIFTYYSN